MQATVIGDLDAARTPPRRGGPRGNEAGSPTRLRSDHALAAVIARQSGDTNALTDEAALAEEFGRRRLLTVAVEAAAMVGSRGALGPGQSLLLQVFGGGLRQCAATWTGY